MAKHRSDLEMEKLNYAANLIVDASKKYKATPLAVVEIALKVLEFGQISAKDFADYLEATGGES